VDFRGHPANLPEIRQIADRHNLKIIEDGSHSIGSTYIHDGRKYHCGDGVHTDFCTYSFHPVKHITTGEGGAVLTNDPDLYRKAFLLRKHGIDRREEMFSEQERIGSWIYDMKALGFNYRITDFQAALGISQLKKIDSIKVHRREIVNYYNEHFSNIDELILPFEDENVDSNFHLYILQVKENSRFDRYDLFTHLQTLNYAPMVHYIPVHLLGYYRKRYGYSRGDFPISEQYYDRAVSIPLYPSLTDAEIEKVVTDITKFIKSK
jgi:dTDP-4-amino-4,6-dideoxygalactose transaminase